MVTKARYSGKPYIFIGDGVTWVRTDPPLFSSALVFMPLILFWALSPCVFGSSCIDLIGIQ